MTSDDDDRYENTQHLSLFMLLAVLTIGNSRAQRLHTLLTIETFDSRVVRDTSRNRAPSRDSIQILGIYVYMMEPRWILVHSKRKELC